MVVDAAIAVVVTPIITAVIASPVIMPVVVILGVVLIGTRGSSSIFLDISISFINVRPLFGDGEQLLDRIRPLTEQLVSEVIVVAETFDEGRDGVVLVDLGDRNPCFRETMDVLAQRLIWAVSDLLQIISAARLAADGHVVVDE